MDKRQSYQFDVPAMNTSPSELTTVVTGPAASVTSRVSCTLQIGCEFCAVRGSQIKRIAAMIYGTSSFRMQRAGVITGRVLYADGEPFSDAELTTHRGVSDEGRATTNDLGEYRVANLLPGITLCIFNLRVQQAIAAS